MGHLRFDYTNALQFVSQQELDTLAPDVIYAHDQLHNKSGKGNVYLGWLDLPLYCDKDELARIKRAAQRIQEKSDAFVVIGVGGSYMGAKAAIHMLSHSFHNELTREKRNTPQIYYIGHNMSATYIHHLLDALDGKEISINVISKSGTTLEPAIAFRIMKEYMERKYGKHEARNRIYVTTDRLTGALKQLADHYKYETFVIPDDIGGRYSVLTAAGLLPIAVSGADLDMILSGAESAYHLYAAPKLEQNQCYQYAAIRYALYNKGYKIELLANYEPSLHYLGEWWKQLFGESEGKDHKGLFPTTASFTTDLHSIGQYIQDGERHLFETTLLLESSKEQLVIPTDEDNFDGLNYLVGKPLDMINLYSFEGTTRAHVDGGVPNLVLYIPTMNEYSFGQLVYFFEKACAISGYLLAVNPFDQPGVEAYKKNMYALLGRL